MKGSSNQAIQLGLDTQLQQIQALEHGSFLQWESEVTERVEFFLEEVKRCVIQHYGLPLPSLLISYVPEKKAIDMAASTLVKYLRTVDITVTLCALTTPEDLVFQSNRHDFLMVLCTPAYAEKVANNPCIRDVIDNVGKCRNDALMAMLCEGSFGDTALAIVDGHYLIRCYSGALKIEGALTCLQTFIDVILAISGSQGLGILPNLLNLEKMEQSQVRTRYTELYGNLSSLLQSVTSQYYLRVHLGTEILQNPLREYEIADVALHSLIENICNEAENKTNVLLCATRADTMLVGLQLERSLLKQNRLTLTIDCADYPGKAGHHCVQLVLQKLRFRWQASQALKENPIVILFKNYEQLGAYDNLYVKNQLIQWRKVTVFITCHTDFFQYRNYHPCFLRDPANPQFDNLNVQFIPHFAPIEAEKLSLTIQAKSVTTQLYDEEDIPHPKSQAMYYELTRFLENLHDTLVMQRKLHPQLQENPQAFISYAWESTAGPEGKKLLIRQQRHLSRIAHDLITLGIPTWLDIERMTGDIDQQMVGHIGHSRYALIIGTPRYTERAGQVTNVQKEYLSILEKQSKGSLTVFPLQFFDDGVVNAVPSELAAHPNTIDFRKIDDMAIYIEQVVHLTQKLLGLDLLIYQKHLTDFKQALELLPASHLITDKNQDAIQVYDIDNRLKNYVLPYALRHIEDPLETRFNLLEHFEDFLQGSQKTYVTLGRAGSGKSLFTLFMFKRLLQKWHEWRASSSLDRPIWLPIYISLKSYANEKAGQAIQLGLMAYGLDEGDISQLQQGLGVGQKVLFILDGYDEMGSGVLPNYSKQLQDWPHAKLLVSSRPEQVNNHFQPIESFLSGENVKNLSLVYVSPFSPKEIKTYIDAYAHIPDSYHTILAIPGLFSLLNNPFMLNIVLQALPLLQKNYATNKKVVRRSDIYQAFINTLLNKEIYKQQQISSDFLDFYDCHLFAETLAFQLFQENRLMLSTEQTSLWQWFSDKHLALVRTTCPLKRIGEEYSFIHKSVYEYFVACYLWENLMESIDTLTKGHPWNTRLFTQENVIVDFLVDFYKMGRSFRFKRSMPEKEVRSKVKGWLFEFIRGSQKDKTLAPSAANAITVLNGANVVFWGCDLRGSRIPHADLRGAICNGANFEAADLRQVQWDLASLSDANFQLADMQDGRFGEFPCIRVEDHIRNCCYSRDGHLLAMVSGKTVQIYDATTRDRHYLLRGPYHKVDEVSPVFYGLSFDPQGAYIASGYDKLICIWNLQNGVLQQTLVGHTANVRSVAFSEEGQFLVSGSEDKTVCLWDRQTGECQMILQGHTRFVSIVLFSPYGDMVSGSWDNTIRFWSRQTGELLKVLEGHIEPVNAIAFNANGQRLVSASEDGSICIWNQHGKLLRSLKEHAAVECVAFSPTEACVAAGGEDRTIRLWNIETGIIERILGGHTAKIQSLAFNPSGTRLISGGESLRLWNLNTLMPKRDLEGHTQAVCSIAFSPDGQYIISASTDGTLYLWDREEGILQGSLEGHTKAIDSIVFSPDGCYLASASEDGTVRLWDMRNRNLRQMLEKISRACSVVFSPDGKYVACGGAGNAGRYAIHVWETDTGAIQKQWGVDQWQINCVAFSPDGKFLALGGSLDGLLRLWDIASGVVQQCWRAPSWMTRIIFSSDGKQLISASKDGTIHIWDVEKGIVLRKWQAHNNSVNSIALHVSEQLLASGGNDGTVRLWELTRGELQKCLNMYAGAIHSVAFYPSRDKEIYLVIGCEDGSVRYGHLQRTDAFTFDFKLLWCTRLSTKLSANNTKLHNVQGLSLSHAELLEQRGAQGKPDILSALNYEAAAGSASAQTELGRRYLKGDGVTQDIPTAMLWLTKAIVRNQDMTQLYLGLCYQHNKDVEANWEKALACFTSAANGGNVQAQLLLGEHYRKHDPKIAFDWFNKAAIQGDREGLFALGECFRLGEGIKQDYRRAYLFYSNAARQEHSGACLALQGIPNDFPRKDLWYAAEQGDKAAQRELGHLYRNGQGDMVSNLQLAATWYDKAAKQGDGQAQYWLGVSYEEGFGIEQNSQEAFHWFSQVLLAEDKTFAAPAHYYLGFFYHEGYGVAQDCKKAAEHFLIFTEQGKQHCENWQKRADLGEALTQCRMGFLYKHGLGGVKKNLNKAIEYFLKAAEQNQANAEIALGDCYAYGEGVVQNLNKTKCLYDEAIKQGNKNARLKQQMIERYLAPSKEQNIPVLSFSIGGVVKEAIEEDNQKDKKQLPVEKTVKYSHGTFFSNPFTTVEEAKQQENALFTRGQDSCALTQDKRAISIDIKLAEAWYYTGGARMHLGHLEKSNANYGKAIEEFQKALEAFQKAQQLKPDHEKAKQFEASITILIEEITFLKQEKSQALVL